MAVGVNSPGNKESDLLTSLQALAAPGALFARSGKVNSGAYLLTGTVVSNTTGFPVRLNNADLLFISVAVEVADTFQIEISEWDGVTETLLATLTATASKTEDFTPPAPIPVTFGNELRCKVSSGSCRNPIVVAFITGEVPT